MQPMIRSSLTGLALAATLLATPALSQVAGPGSRPVEFKSTTLPAKHKELLTRYAEVVGRWALVQRIVQAVEAQNEREIPMQRIEEIDRVWQSGGNPSGLANELARNECAQALQSLLAVNPGYAEAFVSDARGALVCMSTRISDYYQGDEETFRRAWADGAGAAFISASAPDESTGLDLVHISVPVLASGRVVGVLTAGRIVSGG